MSISLPKQTARAIDKTRKKLGLTRSEFFRIMLRQQQLEQKFDLAELARAGGSFVFLENEPEIYGPNLQVFFRRAKQHAGRGGPADLAEKHDKYLY